MTDDTVVVAAGAAWDYYLRHSAYVCQGGRSFRPVGWMGFYRRKRIEPLVPKILERRDHVMFTFENAHELTARAEPFDVEVARVILDSLGEGSRHERDVHDVFLLTAPDDPRTNARTSPLIHDDRGAWTMGQRYADLDKLLSAQTTGDLASSGAKAPVLEVTTADLFRPLRPVRWLGGPPSAPSSAPTPDADRVFVQFIHPGGEHGQDRPGNKHWNIDDHRRKFIHIGGEYLRAEDESPRRDELVFWGEWEPESEVEPIAQPVPRGPRWMHTPYYVPPDSYSRDGHVLQNTDPYVFGDPFQYTLCRQLRGGRPTFLRDLAPGSLVLFGSLKAGSFVLDTVFVVADGVLHTDDDWPETLRERIDVTYIDVTIRPAYQADSAQLRHYRGATHSNPVDGMFSFVPCLPFSSGRRGFARPAIRLDDVITPSLPRGAKATPDLSSSEICELWHRIVEQVLEQGLCLGLRFDLPPRRSHTSEEAVPQYVAARIKKPPPSDCHVLPRSTPIVAFGDPRRARTATLGLNPSRIEFYEKGTELDGSSRRFETLDSLGVDSLADARDETVARVWHRCAQYFHGNPYRWFRPLEEILNAAGASYFDDSACHLDLTQWATDPTWNDLPGQVREHLVEDDVDFLREQLRVEPIELLLLNGRRVISGFTERLGGRLRRESRDVQDRAITAAIYTGEIDDVRVIGWSTNLQSSFGVTRLFRQRLAERVAELARPD